VTVNLLSNLSAGLILAAAMVTPVFAGGAPDGDSLLRALREGDETRAAQLIGPHAGVNARDDTGATPLMWAAQRSNADLTALLLKAGANPNLRDTEGLGPLQIAIGLGATQVALELIAHGADAKTARDSGETVLMTAARMGQVQVMQQLIEHGAGVNAHENQFHQTALMWASGHPDAVKLLLQHGADVRARTTVWEVTETLYKPRYRANDGYPWLHDGEHVSQKGGQDALLFAVQQDDLESAKALLDAGADVDAPAADGSTALLLALLKWNTGSGGRCDMSDYPVSFHPDPAIANLLLDRGAKVSVADTDGYTPLHGAVLGLVPRIRMSQFCRIPSIHEADAEDKTTASVDPKEGIALIKRLLAQKADPNAMTRFPMAGPVGQVHISFAHIGSTPMHIAASTGNVDLMKLLIQAGGDPNRIRPDGHSPLSLAVQEDDLALLKLLVAEGGDVKRSYDPEDPIVDVYRLDGLTSSAPRHNETLLHIAAAAGSYRVIPFLAAQGVSLTAKNDKGETPLTLAQNQEKYRYARDRRDADLHRRANVPDIRDPAGIVMATDTSDTIQRLLQMKPEDAQTASLSN
jgi:ankyrin repeat protein